MYSSEKELYPDVTRWLENYLKGRHPHSKIKAYDTSRQDLSIFLRQKHIHHFFPEFETYVIKVDVTAYIKNKNHCELAFVECKLNPINLKDISQLLGYSKVVRPKYSLIVSPAGISSPVNTLINIFKRYDVLAFQGNSKIRIAKWNKFSKEIDVSTVLPHGNYL